MPRTTRLALFAALIALACLTAAPAFAADSDVTITDNAGVVVEEGAVDTTADVDAAADAAQHDATTAPQPGALLGAGSNALGELGQGDVGSEENFWQSGSAANWTKVATGDDTSCGIQAPGTLWCWGANGSGQLGQGDVSVRKVPTQVGAATDWASVAVGPTHVCALRASGDLYCWGSGSLGKLGLGSSSSQRTPQLVGSGYATVTTAVDSTCATKTSGTLWCWGYGASGQLGLGSASSENTPQQLAGNGWATVTAGAYHTCATRTDGTLWCWGDNNLGEAGVGNTSKQKTPVQVGSARDWKGVSAGYDSTCATKTTGTLWCWGYGASGQLGLGDTSSVRVPMQVGSAADWDSVSSTRYSTCARKADTSFWCWGYNAAGQLGLGDTGKRTSPEQVTTPITVDVVASGSTADQMLVVSQDATPVNACPATPTSQAFARFGDLADYSLAPGGDFEGSMDGWSLTNARVVDGNETLGVTAGSKSLLLGGPKGGGSAEAITPEFCMNDTHPSFRYTAKNSSTAAGILYASLRFRSKRNPGLVLQVTTRSNISEATWTPSRQIPLATLIASSLLKQGGTVQLVLRTSAATANTGGLLVDSLLVDPYRRG